MTDKTACFQLDLFQFIVLFKKRTPRILEAVSMGGRPGRDLSGE
jgi:hypothetical protein